MNGIVRRYLEMGWPVPPKKIEEDKIIISKRLEFDGKRGYFNGKEVTLPRFVALSVIEHKVEREYDKLALMHSIPEGKPRVVDTVYGTAIVLDNHYVVLGSRMALGNIFYGLIPGIGFYNDGKLWETELEGVGKVDVCSIRSVPDDFFGDEPYVRFSLSRVFGKKQPPIYNTIELVKHNNRIGPIEVDNDSDVEKQIKEFYVKRENSFIDIYGVYLVDGWYWTTEVPKKIDIERINGWYYVDDPCYKFDNSRYYTYYNNFGIVAYPNEKYFEVINPFGIIIGKSEYEGDPVPSYNEIERLVIKIID